MSKVKRWRMEVKKGVGPGSDVQLFEDPEGSVVFHSDHAKCMARISTTKEEPVNTYRPTPSGKMKKVKNGVTGEGWVHLADHQAHLAALEIRFSREDETAVQGHKHPHPPGRGLPITADTAESWRYNFNSTMGPYLHMDDNGEWIPWRVHKEVVEGLIEKKTAEDDQLRARFRSSDSRDHRFFVRNGWEKDKVRAERNLLRHDVRVLLEWITALDEGDSDTLPGVMERRQALMSTIDFIREMEPEYRKTEDDDNEE